MKVKEMETALGLQLLTKDLSEDALNRELSGGYVSDLLSNVMGQSEEDMVWITMQGHKNVAAAASLMGIAAVVVAGGAPVADETLSKAAQNDVAVFSSAASAFELAGKLYCLGVGR
ncbi:MAG: serine kinase [Acidaminococcaceae bacterium]|nr:serine kinase [Acidaminococcaceae bacterium]